MSDEALATIRDALTWMDHFAKRHCDGTIENAANEALDALALLDADVKLSVPMAMLLEIDSPDTHQRTESQLINLAARYGYVVGSDIDP